MSRMSLSDSSSSLFPVMWFSLNRSGYSCMPQGTNSPENESKFTAAAGGPNQGGGGGIQDSDLNSEVMGGCEQGAKYAVFSRAVESD